MRIWILLLVCGFAVASAVRYDDDDDFEGVDPDTTEGKTFIDTIKAGFQVAINKIKERLDKSKELASEFGDRLKDITKKLADIGKDFGGQTLQKVREINRKLKDLARDILKRITGGGKFAKRSVASEMRDIFLQIKCEIMTKAGVKEVRGHIQNMRTSHPFLLLVKNYILAEDDDHLYEVLEEFFKNLSIYKARYTTKLEGLFQRIGKLLRTEEGFDVLYDYLVSINSNHPLVSQLHMILMSQDRDDARELIEKIIDAFEH